MDEAFQVPSPEAAEALDAASSMLEGSAGDGNGVLSTTAYIHRCLPDDKH